MRDGLLAAVLPLVLLGAGVDLASAAPLNDPQWHAADSDVAKLFRRYTPSPSDANFTSNYPASGATPPNSSIPQAWINKLNTVTLPNFGPSSLNGGYPLYTGGESGGDSTICSFTYACTTSDDLYNPPNGTLALTFDDGPAAGSADLYAFLDKNNASAKATHFMIGGSILNNPTEMQAAASAGGLIAVHTWSHPYMTTLSNYDVVSELGWTMQIISDLNGGRVPKYWRPPYGDVDNRVRAIAKGVFGLITVPWNQDSADWAIGNNAAYTNASVEASINGWLSGSKSPGLCILEHELNANTVGVFETVYPNMVSYGWNILNVADAWDLPWYQNAAKGNTGAVTSMTIASGATLAVVNASASSTSSASMSASTSTVAVNSTSTSMSMTSSSSASMTMSSSATTSSASATATTSKSAGMATRASAGASGGVLALLGVVGALLL